MTEQKLDKLEPTGLTVNVDSKRGLKEPNPPGTSVDKHKRLRKLLWAGAWKTRDVELIAWDENAQCWRCWERR